MSTIELRKAAPDRWASVCTALAVLCHRQMLGAPVLKDSGNGRAPQQPGLIDCQHTALDQIACRHAEACKPAYLLELLLLGLLLPPLLLLLLEEDEDDVTPASSPSSCMQAAVHARSGRSTLKAANLRSKHSQRPNHCASHFVRLLRSACAACGPSISYHPDPQLMACRSKSMWHVLLGCHFGASAQHVGPVCRTVRDMPI